MPLPALNSTRRMRLHTVVAAAGAPKAQGRPNPKGPSGGGAAGGAPSADKFFQQKGAPAPFLGPVAVVVSPGRGHGLGASKVLNAGDLLLVSPPLAVVSEEDFEEDEDEEEEGEDVMDLKFNALQRKLLSKKYTQAELAWLEALSPAVDTTAAAAAAAVGADASAPSAPPAAAAGPLPDLETLILRNKAVEAERTLACSLSEERLEGVIQANAFEAASEDTDLAYVALEDVPAAEVMGLWPHYALLNHSCAPNTISYPHKGMLITRATRGSTSKGAELTTNYIGDLLHSPLDVRREALEDTYGFVCACARCKDEERMGADIAKLATDIYEACTEQVREDLEAAIEEDDTATLQGLRDQLAAFVEVLDAAFIKKKVPDQTQIWIQAGLFELYELLYTTLEALGQSDMRLLELLQALAAEAQPGSDLHCFYSRRLLAAAEAEEEEEEGGAGMDGGATPAAAPSSKHAQGVCYQAYTTRYGSISRKVFQSILDTRAQAEEEDEEGEEDD